MDGTKFTESDVFSLVNELKKKIVIATAIVMVKWARREGISPMEFTRNFQEKYIRENQDQVDPILEQKYLSHCQDEVLEKLRKAIPAPDLKIKIEQNSEDSVSVGGGSLDWIEDCTSDSKMRRAVKNDPSSPVNATPKKVFSSKDHALKNIEFIESILRLSEESKRISVIPTSLLQCLLYDEDFSQPQGVLNNHFSDDSGIGMSEKSTEDREEVKYVSSGVVRFALQTFKTKQLVIQSMKFGVNHTKNEIMRNTKAVFSNWKGSLPEYACEVLSDCSRVNTECMEMLLVFVVYVLDDIWNDTILSQHQIWEMKISMVSELFANSEICFEVLKYISDKIDQISKRFMKKTSHVALLTEKLALFLNLYCDVCGKVKELKSKAQGQDEDENMDSEDIKVTRFWEERWCAKDKGEDSRNLIKEVMDSQIKILEHFTLKIFHIYPIVSMLAVGALNKAIELKNLEESR